MLQGKEMTSARCSPSWGVVRVPVRMWDPHITSEPSPESWLAVRWVCANTKPVLRGLGKFEWPKKVWGNRGHQLLSDKSSKLPKPARHRALPLPSIIPVWLIPVFLLVGSFPWPCPPTARPFPWAPFGFLHSLQCSLFLTNLNNSMDFMNFFPLLLMLVSRALQTMQIITAIFKVA